MALQRTRAHVPMARGLAEQLDERIAPAAGAEAILLEARNVQFGKTGRHAKRNGFTAMANLDSDGDPLPVGTRGLFSTGTELCVVGERQLYSYVDRADRWYNRGQVGPGDGRIREIYHSQVSYTCPDLDSEGGYVLYTSRSLYNTTPGPEYVTANQQVSIVQSVQTVEGISVIPPTEYHIQAGDDPAAPHAPRACSSAGRLFGLWLAGVAPPNTLYRSDYLTSTPATAPASPVAMFADVYWDGANRRTYDSIRLASGWLLAYIRSTDNAVMIYRYSDDHVLQAAGSIAGPWYRVAVADSPTTNQVYLLLVRDNGGSPDLIYVYALDRSALAVSWLQPVDNLVTADDRVMNLGITESGTFVHAIWDFQRGNNIRQSLIDHTVLPTNGLSFSPRLPIYNATIRSRPWYHGGRTYCWLETAVAGVDEEIETVQFFEAAFAVDLETDLTGTPEWWREGQPRLAGVHSVGAILPYGNIIGAGLEPRQLARQCGSANTVASPGLLEYRYASTRLARSVQDVQPRLTTDEVQLCFGELPITAVVHEGAAIIGGSFYAWFAGSQTEELSFVTPPIVENKTSILAYPRDTASTAGVIPDGVYSYQAHWATSDVRGNLHRSLPSNIVQHEKDSGQAIILATRTCPASLRFPRIAAGREASAIVHRAGADAVQKRITRPVDLQANVTDAHIIEHLDFGQLFDPATGSGTGTPIYTTGGAALEASCPEGGQIVAKVGDRIWLGDQYRRERIQASNELAPRTGTEDVLAPEFNELLGFVAPSGRPIAGIGDLDGKAVMFTSEEIYVISGRGPDAAGNGNDWSGLVPISTDTGCRSARSVVSTPFGVVFAGTAGFYLLDRTLQLTFIGAAVEETLRQYPYVTSAVLIAERHRTEVRFTCNLTPPSSGGDQGKIVVWNYESKQWSVWDVTTTGPDTPFIDACMHQGVYHALSWLGEIYREDDSTWYDDGDKWVTQAGSTAHLQPSGQSGWQRFYSAILLQESRDPHDLTIEIYSDFEDTPSQSYTWTAAELAAFPAHPKRQQPRMGIRRQKAQAQRIRWYDSEAPESVTGEGFTMVGITAELGVKRGLVKVAKGQRS